MMEFTIRDTITMQTLRPEDASNVFAVIDQNRNYLRQWLPWVDETDSPVVTENVIASWEKEWENGSGLVLGIFQGNRYIGTIGLHDMKGSNNSAMIGYWLAQSEQGGGIMTACVRTLVDYAFDSLSVNRIYIYCADANKKSRAIPERLGFMLEGMLQDGECLYGQYYDLAVYGMVRRHWLRLVTPTSEHKQAAWEYRQAYIDCGEAHIHGSGGFLQAFDYESWLAKITAAQTAAQTGWVNCSTYFAFVADSIVGTIQVRHCLNEALHNTGGHIGYGVRPTERRKGYATNMLALALEKCRELGIHRALVTCDKDNIASAKTIQKGGGVLENECTEEDGNVVQRYWIML